MQEKLKKIVAVGGLDVADSTQILLGEDDLEDEWDPVKHEVRIGSFPFVNRS